MKNKIKHILKSIVIYSLCFIICIAFCSCNNNDKENLDDTNIQETKTDYFNLTSVELVKKMGFGYNLGCTLEGFFNATVDTEWNHKIAAELGCEENEDFSQLRVQQKEYRGLTTQNTIDEIYKKGFRSIRLPVDWENHVDENLVIKKRWLDRVQQVVDYCMKYDDLFVIINIMETKKYRRYHLDDEYFDSTLNYITKIWEQVSNRFCDYDARLIFECVNEPVHSEYRFSLNSYAGNQTKINLYKKCVANLNVINQRFVDTVREQGSENNKKRFLTVGGYGNNNYNIMFCTFAPFVIPFDTASHKLIINVHSYEPSAFCSGQSDGKYKYFEVEEWTDEYDQSLPYGVKRSAEELNKAFVQKGYGVIQSEWGSEYDETYGREAERAKHAKYLVKTMILNGICPMVWDSCNFTSEDPETECFGILNRYLASGIVSKGYTSIKYNTDTLWFHERVVDAMKNGYDEAVEILNNK